MDSEVIGESISNLRLEQIPKEILHAAKRSLMDTLGAALAGVTTEVTGMVLATAKSWGGDGPGLVWGTPHRLTVPHAALVNGTAAHAREVDDFGGCGHSGAVVVPAVLAACELAPASGSDLLVGIVAGYETAVRVIDSLGGYRPHNARGWHGTGTAGVFGAAAGSGSVLKLDPQQMAWSMGLAGTYTGGIWAFIHDGAMSKRLHAGKAAETGLVASLLAHQGFSGPLAVFEPNQWGSFTSLYGADLANPEALLQNIGEEWSGILRSGNKPYACCRGIHQALDAAFFLKEDLEIEDHDIRDVLVRASEQTVKQLGRKDVRTLLDAQMSLPFSLTLAFVIGKAGLDEYEPPMLSNPALTQFMTKIRVEVDEDIKLGEPAVVEVLLKDGRRVRKSILYAKGDPNNPLTDQELVDKFIGLASRTIPETLVKTLAEAVWSIEEFEKASDFVELLSSPK